LKNYFYQLLIFTPKQFWLKKLFLPTFDFHPETILVEEIIFTNF